MQHKIYILGFNYNHYILSETDDLKPTCSGIIVIVILTTSYTLDYGDIYVPVVKSNRY
jgi:hypothetical protein